MGTFTKPASAFVDTELVQRHLTVATAFVAKRAADIFWQGHDGALRNVPSLQFDSPLEVLFWIWWNACNEPEFGEDEGLNLRPQTEVIVAGQRYVVDFLVEPAYPLAAQSTHWTPIAVELDGHEFHERTREQVAIRDQRDRALQQAGWKVFHFSFNEFTKTPDACTFEVLMFSRRQLREVLAVEYRKTITPADLDVIGEILGRRSTEEAAT